MPNVFVPHTTTRCIIWWIIQDVAKVGTIFFLKYNKLFIPRVLNPQDWCNNCEMRNIPWCAKHPGLHAPYCRACHTADLPCRNCGVKPSNGPDDYAFAPPGLGADQLFVQIAGTNMPNP